MVSPALAYPLVSLDDFHHRNYRERQEPMGLTVGGRIAGNSLVNGFADFGEDVSVQQRFVHQGTAAMVALP